MHISSISPALGRRNIISGEKEELKVILWGKGE